MAEGGGWGKWKVGKRGWEETTRREGASRQRCDGKVPLDELNSQSGGKERPGISWEGGGRECREKRVLSFPVWVRVVGHVSTATGSTLSRQGLQCASAFFRGGFQERATPPLATFRPFTNHDALLLCLHFSCLQL